MSQTMPKSREEYERILAELPPEQQESYRRLVEWAKPWEELHPDLRRWIVDEGPFGKSLKHPLVYDVFYAPGVRDGQLNTAYKAKREALRDYMAEGNWNAYVFMHERPWRLHALLEIEHHITDDCAYWDLVGGIWTDTENAWQNYAEWEEALSAERPCREAIMDEGEREVLAGLDSEFVIWRGYGFLDDHYDGAKGFSWSLSYTRAKWFAQRFAGTREDTAMLAKALVRKRDVIAYFDGRGEEEILVMPENVNIIERREV